MDKERRAIRRDRNKQHLHQDRDEGARRPRDEDRPRDRHAWRRILNSAGDDEADGDEDDSVRNSSAGPSSPGDPRNDEDDHS